MQHRPVLRPPRGRVATAVIPVLATSLGLSVGCGAHGPRQAPHPAVDPSTGAIAFYDGEREPVAGRERAMTPRHSEKRSRNQPESPDVSRMVMGWMVLGDARPLVGALARAMEATAETSPNDPYGAVRALASSSLGVDPRIIGAIDLSKPLAIGLLNPSLLKGATAGSGGPVLALVPLRAPNAASSALKAAGVPVEDLGWGVAAMTPAGKVYVAEKDGYAAIAFRPDLVDAARKTLQPALASAQEAPLGIHVSVDNVYEAYGRELLTLVGAAGPAAGGADPQLSFALRGARSIARFTRSLRSVDLLVNADDGGLTVTARADGKQGGDWAKYVAAQQPGPVWGARLVPKDAVLVYSTHRNDAGASQERDAAITFLGDAARPPAPSARRNEWRGALDKLNGEMTGELIYSVFPGDKSGMGVGGAFRLKHPRTPAARAALLAAYRHLGRDMAGVVARSLDLDIRRYPVAVTVHPAAARIDGVPVDTVEARVRWPRRATAERKRFQNLFGDQLVVATAVVGDAGVFAAGHDWKSRLGRMMAATRGDDEGSLVGERAFLQALEYRVPGRISLTYLPTRPMVRFLGVMMKAGRAFTAAESQAIEPLLTAAGDGAIVSTTNVGGARMELTTRLPSSSLPGLTQIGGVLWRMALSPLLNPPTIPPLPVPPVRVSPSRTRPMQSLR